MKFHFLLDKNIIVFASKLSNSDGEPNLNCADLLLEIILRCHRLALYPALKVEYLTKLNSIGKLSLNVPKVLDYALHTLGKVELIDQQPQIPNEKELNIKEEDIEFARIAYHCRNIMLVTEDMPLIDKLAEIDVKLYKPTEILEKFKES